jgi:hypothetical protein
MKHCAILEAIWKSMFILSTTKMSNFSDTFLPRHIAILNGYPNFNDFHVIEIRFVIIYPAAVMLRSHIRRDLLPRQMASSREK